MGEHPLWLAISSDQPQNLNMDPKSEMIRGAYQEGKENAAFHLNCSEAINLTATKMLTLIAGAGYGALGYGAHLLESGGLTAPAAAVIASAVHLLIIGALIVSRCLAAEAYEPTTNEPENLFHEGFTWDAVLEEEIKLLNVRINQNRDRNARIGCDLNCLMWFAMMVPITFVVVLVLAWSVLA